MSLLPSQWPLLKTDILADPTLAQWAATGRMAAEIAIEYNKTASPAWTVWRSSVETSTVMANGFTWTEVDQLTGGKARIWEWMASLGTINPAKSNVRQGLRDCFGASSATYLGMLPYLKRPATRAEKLFTTGSGTDSNPATMTFEGTLTYQDVEQALAS